MSLHVTNNKLGIEQAHFWVDYRKDGGKNVVSVATTFQKKRIIISDVFIIT